MFDECDEIGRKVTQLSRLGYAAATLHQDGLANELFGVAQTLEAVAVAIRDHMSARSQSDYQQATQSTGNMIRAVLAVAERRP